MPEKEKNNQKAESMKVINSVKQAVNSALEFTACMALTSILYLAFNCCSLFTNLFPKYNKIKAPNQDQRLVVITGADTGMGRSLVDFLAEHSAYHVLALCLTEQAAKELNNKNGGKSLAIKCDLTNETDINKAQKFVTYMLSTKKEGLFLYSLINCAATADPGDFLWNNYMKSAKLTMDVNFFGTLQLTHALLPTMVYQNQKAQIINITSVNGVVPTMGNSAYSASKFALEGWSHSLRKELKAFGIDVVCVRPGGFKTPIHNVIRERIFQNFRSASPEIQYLYGGEEYLKKWGSFLEQATGAMQSPEIVSALLYDILETKNPKPAYWAGIDASILFRAFHILPTVVTDSVLGLLMNFKPLNAGRQLPASIKATSH